MYCFFFFIKEIFGDKLKKLFFYLTVFSSWSYLKLFCSASLINWRIDSLMFIFPTRYADIQRSGWRAQASSQYSTWVMTRISRTADPTFETSTSSTIHRGMNIHFLFNLFYSVFYVTAKEILWISDIFVSIRTRDPMTYGSGSGSCSFSRWLSKCQKNIYFLRFLSIIFWRCTCTQVFKGKKS